MRDVIFNILLLHITLVVVLPFKVPQIVQHRSNTPKRGINGQFKNPTLTTISSLSDDNEDTDRQWGLGRKHHWINEDGSTVYRGASMTYSSIGDVLLNSPQTFTYTPISPTEVSQELAIHDADTSTSDCTTCYDSSSSKILPLPPLRPPLPLRFASLGYLSGPIVLRSGAMSTELCLSYSGSRVRCTFVHAPAWTKGSPETGIPDGLGFLRCTIVKESTTLPTFSPSEEDGESPKKGNAYFFRPTPPFEWQYIHSGTSWTWGPNAGDSGWSLPEVEEPDAWHSRPRGDGPNVWSLRLGSVLVQCPDFLPRGGNVSTLDTLFRLAWIPNPERLLRAEASVIAMREIEGETDEGVRVGRPERGSFRVDVLEKIGEPESQIEKEKRWEAE